MPFKKKITFKDYYVSPDIHHMTGDIWLNLPTMGLLKNRTCSGIIITPACDLENSKVETLTYLPIISVKEYFVSRPYYPYLVKKVISISNSVQDYTAQSLLAKNFLPTISDLNFIISEYEKKPKDKKGVVQRIINGLELTRNICDKESLSVDDKLLINFFTEKEYQLARQEIIKNSFSNDLHFLPKDEQDTSWSAIKNHSVVLFRYPITIPIEIMDTANDISILNWTQKMAQMCLNPLKTGQKFDIG